MENTIEVSGEIKSMTVTQRQMGAALGLSSTRISQLIDEGILIRDESSRRGRIMLFESLENHFLSKKATGDGVNFWKERGLHEKAKREMAELKLRERRGELYEATLVEAILAEMLANFRNKLLGLGHKLALQLEEKTAAEICAAIDGEIGNELTELSQQVAETKWSSEADG